MSALDLSQPKLANVCKHLRRLPWFTILSVAVGVSTLLHSCTLLYSPLIWQDEVEIVDGGRVLAGGSGEFGITWVREGRPFRFLYYIGCLLQNCACSIAGSSPVGPRLLSLVGAGFAAVALTGWLYTRGATAWVATACSLTFLWDPLFTFTYRGGRVDCWAIGFFLLALWMRRVRCGLRARDLPESAHLSEAVAGVLIGIAGMTWISAALLIPLYVWDVFTDTKGSPNHASLNLGCQVRDLAVAGVCALVTVALLWAPILNTALAAVRDTQSNIGAATDRFDIAGCMTGSIKGFPFVVPAAIIMMFIRPRVANWIALLAAVTMVAASRPYVNRIVYLLPYFCAVIADGFTRESTSFVWSQHRRKFLVLLGLLPLPQATLSLALRGVNAICDKNSRDPILVEQMCDQLQINDSTNVYIPYEFYYAARKRKCKYYHCFGRTLTDKEKFFDDLDMAIFKDGDSKDPGECYMAARGFSRKVLEAHATSVGSPVLACLLIQRLAYGPFVVYVREDNSHDIHVFSGGQPAEVNRGDDEVKE